jgi:hypothetical protein
MDDCLSSGYPLRISSLRRRKPLGPFTNISMSDMRRFLEMPFAPINLMSLFVNCPSTQSAEQVHSVLRCVAEGCQLLKVLYLELLWMDSPNIFLEREDRITFEVLEPLLACSCLECKTFISLIWLSSANYFMFTYVANSHYRTTLPGTPYTRSIPQCVYTY